MNHDDSNQDEETTELAGKKGVYVKSKEEAPPPTEPLFDFSTYIISLGHTVQIALGLLPIPETDEFQIDLPVAKQFIDIIAMLREKTDGNLTQEEAELIDSILSELRIQYVARKKKA